MSWTELLGYFTGLRLLDPEMHPGTLLRTAFVVHACDAVMCRVFAHNNGYPKKLWTLLGFVFGVWAVAILVLLPTRRPVLSGEDEATRPVSAPDAPVEATTERGRRPW